MALKIKSKQIISCLLALFLLFEIPVSTLSVAKAEQSNPIPLNQKAQYVANSYANVEKIVYGKSVMGRDLEAYVINGLGYNDKTIMCTFTVHGFEDFYYRDGQVLTEAANNLIEYLAQYSYMLKDCRVVIVPCANPDGAIDGVNNKRACADAFGRCTADHIDINRDFVELKGQETRALKSLMDYYHPYIFLDLHGWLNEVLGDSDLVDAFCSTNNLSVKRPGVYAWTKGYAYGYAHHNLGSRSALVEFRSPDDLNHAKIAQGIVKAIEYLPNVYNKWSVNRYGWCYVDGYGNLARSRWITDSCDWCYVDWDGVMLTNRWVTDSQDWCYVDGNGHLLRNKWVTDSVGWCYVDGEGHLVRNRWQTDSLGWCYLDGDGHMLKNSWAVDSKGWCYVGQDGRLLTDGWAMDSKSWCAVDSEGHLITNSFAKRNDNTHYMDNDGHLTIGWLELDYNKYYFDKDGIMALGKQTIDGKEYDFGTDGIARPVENGDPETGTEPNTKPNNNADNTDQGNKPNTDLNNK